MDTPVARAFSHPSFAGLAGVGRRDITPPVGIYARQWAARVADNTTTGTHRPLNVTALTLRPQATQPPLVLAAIDLSWFKVPQDEWQFFRKPVIDALQLDPARVVLAYTHTHASCSVSTIEMSLPGGERIAGYRDHIAAQLIESIREALQHERPATLTWATGRCGLASHRDQPDPAAPETRRIVGYAPDVPADDTLLVGRVTAADDGRPMATLVNYACHPTTLAWQNRLASPDYVGAMRELIEQHTDAAPCLFLQGASGELGPRRGFTGDTAIADANGRELGFAVLSVLASMLEPGHELVYRRVVASGADLGQWEQQRAAVPTDCVGVCVDVELPLKQRPTAAQLEAQLVATDDEMQRERIRREIQLGRFVGTGPTALMPLWVWRLGRSVIVAQANEAYSDLQIALRAAFPEHAVAVLNVANGFCGYLPQPELFDLDVYQVWQTPFDREGLPRLIEAARAAVQSVV